MWAQCCSATCQQWRWLWKLANSRTFRTDLSPLSFLFYWCNFLTCFRQKSEGRDKHFTFMRETKLWGIAFCPDLLKQRRESAVYPVHWHRTIKATEEPLCMLCQCSEESRGVSELSYSSSQSVQHTAGITVTHSNCILATNSCTFLLKVKQTPFSRSWTYSRQQIKMGVICVWQAIKPIQ